MHSQASIRSTAGIVATTALAPLLWGSSYIVASEVLPPDRPLTAAALRVMPAGLLLLLWTRRLPLRAHWGRLLLLSLLNIGVFQALLFIAAGRLPGGVAAVLGAIQPLVVMLLCRLVDSRRIAPLAWGAALASVAGMAVMLTNPGTLANGAFDPAGVIAALGGATCMATGTWLGARWQHGMPLLSLTGWQLLLGGLVLAPAALLTEPDLEAPSLSQCLGYLYLSLAGALAAYVLWFRGIALLPPVATAALGLLSPVSAVLLGWLFLAQSFDGTALAGLCTVLTSILILQQNLAPPAKPTPLLRPQQEQP